jgi:anaerobic ribonucleoside-triphosphate reductase activating protein
MNYGKIKPVDVANGEGVRVSLFVFGCPHRCKGCFNAELWDKNAGEKFTCDNLDELMDLCSKPYISGLSLLGGEPLFMENLDMVNLICRTFKQRFPNKTIWCYTGYRWEHIKQLWVMKFIDVLVDGQFVEGLKDPRLKFRGSSNQRIIMVKPSLESGGIMVRKDLME